MVLEHQITHQPHHSGLQGLHVLKVFYPLLCKWGPLESAELASVANELAPTLDPEFAALFKTVLFTSSKNRTKIRTSHSRNRIEWVPKWWTHVRVNHSLRLLIQYVATSSREPLDFSAIMQGWTNQRETPQCLRFIFSCSDLALFHLVYTQTSL